MDSKKIIALLVINDSPVAKVAKDLGVTTTFVYMVIANVRKTKKVRDYISRAIDVPKSKIWPDKKNQHASRNQSS